MSAKDWLLPAILSVVWGGTVGWIVLVYRTCADRSAGGDNRVQPGGAGRSDPRGSIGPDRRGMAKWPCGLGCIAGMGLLNDIVPFTLFVLAQGRVTAGLAAILNATTPLFTVIVAHLATGDEKAGPTLLAGLAIGFGGVVVTLSGAGATGDLWAKLACLGAALSYGLAGVRGRRFRRMRVAPMTTAFGPLVCSTLVLAPVRLLIDRPCSRPAPGPTAARPRPAPGQTPARPRPDPGAGHGRHGGAVNRAGLSDLLSHPRLERGHQHCTGHLSVSGQCHGAGGGGAGRASARRTSGGIWLDCPWVAGN